MWRQTPSARMLRRFSPFVVAFEGVRQGQIVYNRTAASSSVDGTIWAIYPNGTGDHQITTGSYPRLSPNGNYLAFKRKHSATTEPSNNYGLWIMNLTTGVETEIFYQGDFLVGFDFTLDSLKIVFDWSCAVYQINIDGSNFSTLINSSCFDDAPVIQPTGGLLAFHGQNGGIYTSNANGSNRLQIPNTGSNDYFPFWSKDSQFFAYGHYDGTNPHPYYIDSLYKIRPDGTGKVLLKNLTGTDRFGIAGSWSADGRKIYMPARIGGVTGIYEVATDGSGTISRATVSTNLIAAGVNAEMVGGVNGFLLTAASVTVSGRVTTAEGRGVRNAIVSLIDSNGAMRSTLTAPRGYYRFDEIEAGQTVVISVRSRRFQFTPRIVSVQDELADVDFIAEP